MPDTVSIEKRSGNPYRDLVRGDAWTIIRDEPIRCEDGAPVKPGDMIQLVHSTADGGRFFEIAAVHAGSIYETLYLGSFCEVFPDARDHSGPMRVAIEARRQQRKEIEL